ncbi:AAA family ATPase [Tsukamurella tyrosinosolvens]|uniref:AAA family ATPase n=1 Tax=Tsukamurella tyrosinosolvens TaxID=57704 RepID=UPI003F49FD01
MTTPPPPKDAPPPVQIVTGTWLDAQHFPPVRYVVDRVLAEGLTILVGGPKIGKSWLTLGLALSIAAGRPALGVLPTSPSPCLLLALEDGHRRLQARARHLLGEGVPIPPGLHFIIKGSHVELEGALCDWLDQRRYEQPVVVIDTLGRFRPQRASTSDAFGADYQFIARLKAIIDTVPGGALVLVHHTRKSGASEGGDFVEAVSGTTGLAAAADATLVLTRRRHEDGALLAVTGRDIREAEYALVSESGRWRLDGATLDEAANAAHTARKTDGTGDPMQQVIALVERRAAAGDATTSAEVVEAIDEFRGKPEKARVYLNRAADAGRITKSNRGVYTRVTSVSSVTDTDLERDTRNGRNTPSLSLIDDGDVA